MYSKNTQKYTKISLCNVKNNVVGLNIYYSYNVFYF